MFSLFGKGSDSRELLILAVILAVLFSQDQDEAEIGRLAAFFTILGDTLALFALQPGLFQSCKRLCEAAQGEADRDGSEAAVS